MKPTWYDTIKYWNGKEILRECKDKNRLCVHANVWNTCTDKFCEKGEKMTNREWLNSLSDEELAEVILSISATPDLHSCSVCGYKYGTVGCGSGENCVRGFKLWLGYNHIEPKKELSQAQLCEAFELKFGKRRAISLDEVREVAKEIFK